MPSTGAGWVNLGSWLGLNADAGKQQQKSAINAANSAANPTGATRFQPPRHAQQGTAWSPEAVQSLVHGSMWDAGLAGSQMGGQAGGNMKTQQVGGGAEMSETGRGNGPKMTRYTAAQTVGTPMGPEHGAVPVGGPQVVGNASRGDDSANPSGPYYDLMKFLFPDWGK